MIKIAIEDFVYQRDVPQNHIGVLSRPGEVIIFLPGDETTPEWVALHPAEIPVEVPVEAPA